MGLMASLARQLLQQLRTNVARYATENRRSTPILDVHHLGEHHRVLDLRSGAVHRLRPQQDECSELETRLTRSLVQGCCILSTGRVLHVSTRCQIQTLA